MKFHKVLSMAVVLVLSISLFAACGTGQTPAAGQPAAQNSQAASSNAAPAETTEASGDIGPAELRMWAHWGSEQRRPTIEKMINMFNDEYADMNISAEYVFVPFGEIETKYVAAVAGGIPPDVIISAIEAVNVRAMRNQASDITDYIDASTQSKFYDRFWDAALYEGRVYALPFNTDTRMIYYNKEMFAQAGVDANAIQTWQDLLDAGDKLDAAMSGQSNFKMAFHPLIGNFGYNSIAVSNSATTWDDEMNPNVPVMNNAANVQALEYTRQWLDRYDKTSVQGMVDSSGSGAEDPFISGQVAMFGQTCNYIATLERYGKNDAGEWMIDYGTFVMPTGPSFSSGGNRAVGGGFVATVPFGVKNVAAATKLAEFVTCGPAANVWVVEQKDVMCSTEANSQPELAGAVGWDMTLELLSVTQTARRHIYAPDATTLWETQYNRYIKDFEDGVTAQMVADEAKKQIEDVITNEKFIFGVD